MQNILKIQLKVNKIKFDLIITLNAIIQIK